MSDWRAWGSYTGGTCPNCGRQRLMTAEDPTGQERVICEKCLWEPAAQDYAPEMSAEWEGQTKDGTAEPIVLAREESKP